MSTNDEREAAADRLQSIIDADDIDGTAFAKGWRTDRQVQVDAATVVRSYLTERAERQRRIEAAAEKIEQSTMQILLRNGVDMRKHRLAIVKEVTEIITRCLDGETA